MRKFAIGIRAQLTAGIVITTLAGIGLIGILSVKIIEDRSVFAKAVEAEKTARFIRASYRAGEGFGNASAHRSFMEASLREMGVVDFRLTSPGGAVILKRGSLPSSAGEPVSDSGGVSVNRIAGGWFRGPGAGLYVRAYMGESPAGPVLEFIAPLTDIIEDLSAVRRFLFYYALLDSAIIIAFALFYLSRSITAPIKRLEEAATRISSGSLGDRAEVSVDNEIGSLARSFNTMAARLEEEIKTLERVNLELVQTQDELLRSNTLAAVGRLAAGVAHEIGNPLGALQGYLEILSRGNAMGAEEKEMAARAAIEAARIDSIVREFLDLSRPSRRPASPVDVAPVLRDSLSAVEAGKGSLGGVRVDLDIGAGIPPVMFEEGKLRQVFINLISNALQSMETAGGEKVLKVGASVERRAPAWARMPRRRSDDRPFFAKESSGVVEKEFVAVTFTDTGKGISEEEGKRIFDPFFTTKEAGKGTGLGLFVSLSIVRTFGGEITFSSSPGKGTVFTVALPSAGERP